MAKLKTGLCPRCKVALTPDNCHQSTWGRGAGACRACISLEQKLYHEKYPEKSKENQARYRAKYPGTNATQVKKYHQTLKGRFSRFHFRSREENRPLSDLLNSFNFYCELIKDKECHYCLGPLQLMGHALDRIDNSLGHLCYNVVPCCKSCNQKKMHDTSYEEMMLLAPALREIRRRREARKWQTEYQTSALLMQSL